MTRDELRQRLASPMSHPDVGEMSRMADAVRDWSIHFHSTLSDSPVGRRATPDEIDRKLPTDFAETGQPFDDVLEVFTQSIAPFSFPPDHPRFVAFIGSAATFPAIVGDWLATAANFFTGVWAESAGPSAVEQSVLELVREWLGMPPSTRGVLTSGGSEANLTALAVARDGIAFEDRSRLVLYTSDQRHRSVDRAAMILGLSPERVRILPTDSDFRLDPATLTSAIDEDLRVGLIPWAMVAHAGTTNTGAVDPLDTVAGIAAERGIWLHVDAAYGWPLILSDRRGSLSGIDRADSVTFDPHKWFAQPYEVGGLLVRDGPRLTRTFRTRSEYMTDVESADDSEVDFADRGISLSRRCRALKIWFSLKVLGVGWFRELIERNCLHAEYAEVCLREAGFEVVARNASIVCFRHPKLDDDGHARLIERVHATGEMFLSSTRLRGRRVLRMCFINWRTTAGDVERMVRLLCE